jgi:hypothetical protein
MNTDATDQENHPESREWSRVISVIARIRQTPIIRVIREIREIRGEVLAVFSDDGDVGDSYAFVCS